MHLLEQAIRVLCLQQLVHENNRGDGRTIKQIPFTGVFLLDKQFLEPNDRIGCSILELYRNKLGRIQPSPERSGIFINPPVGISRTAVWVAKIALRIRIYPYVHSANAPESALGDEKEILQMSRFNELGVESYGTIENFHTMLTHRPEQPPGKPSIAIGCKRQGKVTIRLYDCSRLLHELACLFLDFLIGKTLCLEPADHLLHKPELLLQRIIRIEILLEKDINDQFLPLIVIHYSYPIAMSSETSLIS